MSWARLAHVLRIAWRTRAGRPLELAPPFPPPQRVGHRADMASASAADDPDGNKLNPMPRREESHQHLGFDFETFRAQRQGRPGFQMDETKTALRIGQVPARAARQLAAHPAVHLPAQPGNGSALCMRLPTTSNAPVCSAHRQKAGKSSGACWPSPSSIKAHSKPRCRARDNPVLSAAPLPRFRR